MDQSNGPSIPRSGYDPQGPWFHSLALLDISGIGGSISSTADYELVRCNLLYSLALSRKDEMQFTDRFCEQMTQHLQNENDTAA